jgi:fatty acid hydroxylase family protein
MEQNVKNYQAFKRGDVKMPEHLRIRKELTAPLFENKFLESLTRTHIFIPVIMHLSINAYLFWYGITHFEIPQLTAVILLVSGFVFWTFAEYMIHRFVYHTESNSRFLYNLQFKAHGIHHQHPKDPTRLAMPPVPGLVLSGVFFLIYWLIMGTYAFAFFPGFMVGYVAYISIHYAQHIIRMPTYLPFRLLWQNHAIHHYQNPYVAHGVSTRLWDFVFGTLPDKKKLSH